MALTNPPYNWVVRYCSLNESKRTVYNFSGFKSNGTPGYAHKFDNIKKFKTAQEAFEAVRQIIDIGGYNAEACRIHIALGEDYYFTGNRL